MADSATVSTVHDISIETGTNRQFAWEDYIGKEHTFEAKIDGQAQLKPTDADTSEWGDMPPPAIKENPDPDGDGLVKQDVYGLCFRNMPETMSWKEFYKFANVDRRRVCGVMRVGKTDIVVFFRNAGQAQQCLEETKGRNLDDIESDEEDDVDEKIDTEQIWWLDRDAKRAQFIDRMLVPNNKAWYEAFGYMERVLAKYSNPERSLYLPEDMVELSKHNTISILFDASLLCDLINYVDPYFIDPRTIHRPASNDPKDAEPLQAWRIRENEQLLVSSCKAMGLPLDTYQTSNSMWFEPKAHVSLVTDIIEKLANRKLETYVSLKKKPELRNLAVGDEAKNDESLKTVRPKEWINRWLNFHNGVNNLSASIQDEDFGNALFETLKKIDTQFLRSIKKDSYDSYDNPATAVQVMLDWAAKKGVNTTVRPSDFVDGNRLLMDLFAAQVFDKKNGLPKLSDKERKAAREHFDLSDDEVNVVSWINALVPSNIRINNMVRDMADGLVILHLLDRIQPGVVKWRGHVKKKVKSKFDKIGNCHYAIELCKKKFPFKIMGIAGTDIVDGNEKYINVLLWQIMRYHATKELARLNFGGTDVQDEDIIAWANETLGKNEKATAKKITAFKDVSLTNCIFYLEILQVIEPESVREDLIHRIPPLPSLGKRKDDVLANDPHAEKRLENVRYAMSLIRRLGGELFVAPEEIIRCEPKAVLSVLVALMTISAVEDKYQTRSKERKMVTKASRGLEGKKGRKGKKGKKKATG